MTFPTAHLNIVTKAMGAGNWAAAEIVCRDLLDSEPENAAALHLLGILAARVGARDHSVAYLEAALALEPDNETIIQNLTAARALSAPIIPECDRYLLIKSWGFGFWADVVHVCGSLLLAEITGRNPVVHWGRESLFSDKSDADAFVQYFEPVNSLGLHDLCALNDATFFPPRWNLDNLREAGVAKWEGKGSRAGALYFLQRPEKIAVSDFFIAVINVLPWIPAEHPLFRRPQAEVYRYLLNKYLRPAKVIRDACDKFFKDQLAENPFVAVHIRGSDKALEDPNLNDTNRMLIDALEAVDPTWKIFALTDDSKCLRSLRERYGKRIIVTDCQRTQTDEGVHYLSGTNPLQAGREVMIDTYLALRAAKFIGNGQSNLSAIVAMMKDWAAGACTLIGPSLLERRNLRIYQIPTFADV